MKIIFLLALLANIVFFLWEFNSTPLGGSNHFYKMDNNDHKQILLQSESTHSAKDKVVLEKNKLNSNRVSAQPITIEPILEEKKPKSVETIHLTNENLENNNSKLAKLSANNIPVKIKNSNTAVSNNKSKSKYFIQQMVKNCYEIGPFKDAVAIEKWRQLNGANIQYLTSFERKISAIENYLVYYPAKSSFSESKKNIQIFQKLGIKDYWMFRDGKLKGAISLGLFNQIEPANLLQEELTKYNIDVEILPRYKVKTIQYATVSTYQPDFKEKAIISNEQTVDICEKGVENKKR